MLLVRNGAILLSQVGNGGNNRCPVDDKCLRATLNNHFSTPGLFSRPSFFSTFTAYKSCVCFNLPGLCAFHLTRIPNFCITHTVQNDISNFQIYRPGLL